MTSWQYNVIMQCQVIVYKLNYYNIFFILDKATISKRNVEYLMFGSCSL